MAQNKTYIVFFDLDKTLLSINSGKELILLAHKKGLMSTRDLIRAIILAIIFKLKLRNPIVVTRLMAKWLKGISEKELSKLSGQLVEQSLIGKIRPSMIQEIELHKKKGAHIVLLSAALPYICEPIAKHLALDNVICSSMETAEGMFTGKPLGNICIGEEKEIRARQYCDEKSFQMQNAYAYGDSYTDQFILKAVGNPVCVAADKKLRELSSKNAWKMID